MKTRAKILLLAGEESGMLYANTVREELRKAGDCEFRGYGDWGFETADLAVMGFWPIIRRIGYFLRVARTLKRAIREWKPDVVVTIDYPGMNLKLAAYAKRRGIPAVHLVCPQVWAWRRGRIPKVAAALTKLLCFFPFEPKLFEGTGLEAKFVGHPLADAFKAESAERRAGLVALLPGSRIGEIQRLLPTMLKAVEGMEYRIPAANAAARTAILKCGAKAEWVGDGGARKLLLEAECAVVASGTATLEAALARCPTVLAYAVSKPLAWFARRVIKGVRHVGLINVIAEKCGFEPPMPELLQEDFTAAATRRIIDGWRKNADERKQVEVAFGEATEYLQSGGNALENAAREIMETVKWN